MFLFGQLLERPVEVGLEQPILNDAVFFKFAFGKSLDDFGTDFAGMIQQSFACQIRTETGLPVLGRRMSWTDEWNEAGHGSLHSPVIDIRLAELD